MSSPHPKFGFSEKVTKKIVSPKELVSLIGNYPRSEKIVMCHGTFDLVHPGHLRHLAFAKSRADKLVVSLTADKFVHKANNRPYVPQDLRALNLASLELVDYVVIDDNAEPIELIKKIGLFFQNVQVLTITGWYCRQKMILYLIQIHLNKLACIYK